MRWFGVSGSWNGFNRRIDLDVRGAATDIVKSGGGIVSRGVWDADFIAAEAAMSAGDRRKQLKIIIPTSLEIYAAHCRRQADEGLVAPDQAERLISQLQTAQALGRSLVEMSYETVDQASCQARDQALVGAVDHLLAFCINQNPETADTIRKAQQKGIPTTIKQYQVDD